ncbi:MAG: EthD family reductase [Burkholderiales bacterium]|jgi:uncharacterized protein (TIGR02118 family)
MFKVSVMYPNKAGATFDHAYYRDLHMPMVKDKLGAAVTRYTVDKGLGGGAPGSPPAFVASCALYVESLEAFQAGMAANGKAIMADVPNYTNIQPQIEVTEVVVG